MTKSQVSYITHLCFIGPPLRVWHPGLMPKKSCIFSHHTTELYASSPLVISFIGLCPMVTKNHLPEPVKLTNYHDISHLFNLYKNQSEQQIVCQTLSLQCLHVVSAGCWANAQGIEIDGKSKTNSFQPSSCFYAKLS